MDIRRPAFTRRYASNCRRRRPPICAAPARHLTSSLPRIAKGGDLASPKVLCTDDEAAAGASRGSWVRIACSTSRRAGPGSTPSSAASSTGRDRMPPARPLGARLVQRPHQQPPGTLPIRVGLYERLELADASLTLATVELRLGGVLDDRDPQFDEPLHLARRHRSVGHALIRLAAKRFGHFLQQADGHLGVPTTQRLARRCHEPVRPRRVDLDESGSSRYPPSRSTIAAAPTARRKRRMCPCSVLRADGGGPAGHNASTNASADTRSPTRATSAASSVCSTRRNRTTAVPSNSSTGPRTRTSTSDDGTHHSLKPTANTRTVTNR